MDQQHFDPNTMTGQIFTMLKSIQDTMGSMQKSVDNMTTRLHYVEKRLDDLSGTTYYLGELGSSMEDRIIELQVTSRTVPLSCPAPKKERSSVTFNQPINPLKRPVQF